MFIRDLYARPQPTVSFEFFPPKSAEAEATLYEEVVPRLKALGASYFSVTYGAGGSTREATMRIVHRLRRHFKAEAVAHLTCVGSTSETIGRILDEAKSLDIDNVLCLRGDPPKDQKEFRAVEGGFSYALELIPFVKERGFGVGAACYPEGHVECPDKQRDWDYAAAKVKAGADFLITQLFYDWDDFRRMEDYLRGKHGVTVPIIPGVLPFLGAAQIKRFTGLCGSKIPAPLLRRLEEVGGDDESVRKLGVETCTDICRKALAHGVKGVHFYCLNRVPSCQEIMHNLGLGKA